MFPPELPHGETTKNFKTLPVLYSAMLDAGISRSDLVIALGGGVIGDLAGFAAASYLRGVKQVQIPTSLLAQVDSSVGGKVAVDLPQGKNLVGAFYQPQFGYINTATMDTLPEREFSAGMAEVIKYGIIQSGEFYNYISENREKIKALDKDALKYIIRACCDMKACVVGRDEHDTGEREVLNYGHTIGHAVEGMKEFELLHGECVSIGMSAVLNISVNRGYISAEKAGEIRELLRYFSLPTTVSGLEADAVYEQLFHDKKVNSNKLKFVIADSVGSTIRTSDISKDEVMEAIGTVLED